MAFVVSSNRSCLPEVLGEAALYFDPENVEQMAETILRGWRMKIFGLSSYKKEEEIKRYSWAKLAEETREIYKIPPLVEEGQGRVSTSVESAYFLELKTFGDFDKVVNQ